MRSLLLCCLLASPSAWARKPKPAPPPETPPEDAVRAFYTAVDALVLDVPHASEGLVGFTMGADGGPLEVAGAEGWASVQQLLTDWGADQGTIVSAVRDVHCTVDVTLAACSAQVHQDFTWKGESAGSAEVRATFVFQVVDGVWSVLHWHESAPTAPPAPEDPAEEAEPEGGVPPEGRL